MLPRESIYVPVYMCVFKFSPKTRGQMKPKFIWNHNRIGEELIQMIQVICCSSLLSNPGGRGLLAGILPQVWPRSAGLLAGL